MFALQAEANFPVMEDIQVVLSRFDDTNSYAHQAMADFEARQRKDDFRQVIEAGDVDAAEALLAQHPTFRVDVRNLGDLVSPLFERCPHIVTNLFFDLVFWSAQKYSFLTLKFQQTDLNYAHYFTQRSSIDLGKREAMIRWLHSKGYNFNWVSFSFMSSHHFII
jgi:hypothetical protein